MTSRKRYVAAAVAAGVLLSGSPGTHAAAASGPSLQARTHTGSVIVAAAADRHRWPGHPGRRLVHHRVRPGDTATGLAVRFHAWTDELRALNRLGAAGTLYVGERIRIPVVVSAESRSHRSHRSHRAHQTHGAHRAQRAHSRHPWRRAGASRATVRRTIDRVARRHGVDPHLALAIGWQESGWQQRRTSSAGAVGAMQVMPGTGTWMSLYAGRPLNIYGLRDNVTAGVLLVKVLRGQTSRRRTIAAYYQGLGAVREHGLYPSTRRYHRSVVALYRRLQGGWTPV